MSTTIADHTTDLKFRTLSSEKIRTVTESLQTVLTDLIALSLLTKQAHWNVIGPNFRPIHLQLDEIYATLQTDVDSVAERLTALGISPNGQAQNVVSDTSVLALDSGFIRDEQLLLMYTDRLQLLIHAIRGQMELVENSDIVSADLLHAVVGGLEKHHWMLAAQCQ